MRTIRPWPGTWAASATCSIARETTAALPLYEEAIRLYTAAQGADHWFTSFLKSGLGACFTTLARYDEAEALLLEAYPILQNTRGAEDTYTQTVIERLMALYEAWGKPDEVATYRAMLPS